MPTDETIAPQPAVAHAHAPAAANHDPRHGHTPIHPKPGTGLRLLLTVTVLAVALGAGYFVVSSRRRAADDQLAKITVDDASAHAAVDVVKVVYGPATHEISLPGESRAWYESTIYARASGYVKQWNVDIGDHVKGGDVLATVETPELDQQLAADEAKVESDKAQVKLAQAKVHFSDVTLARYKDAPKGVVSDVERDEKEADYQTDLARQAAAESDLNSAQADVDRLRAMIAFQKVTAPFDGTITQRHIDIGDLVTAGSTASTTSLFTIAQSDQIRVFVDVPQSLAPDIHDGDPATADSREFPGRLFNGRVARNSKSINNASKTLRVEVDIPNKDLVLLPGMYLQVHFQISGRAPLLQIPAGSIVFRSGGPQVAVVDQDGRVTFHNVEIAHDLGDLLEISKGLSPGDRVALNISNQIATGDTVKANEIELPGTPAPPSPHVAVVGQAENPRHE